MPVDDEPPLGSDDGPPPAVGAPLEEGEFGTRAEQAGLQEFGERAVRSYRGGA